ncbi:unnamed protein product, partial [Didymodactylos carnosus]
MPANFNEQEVLFRYGCIFQIVNVEPLENGIWVIHLFLRSEEDYSLKTLLNHMKSELGVETNIISLGHLFWKMGAYDKAKTYCRRLLQELTTDDLTSAQCYEILGLVAYSQEEYQQALINHFTALSLRLELIKPIYGSIELIIDDTIVDDAILPKTRQLSEVSPLDIAACFNNIGNVLIKKEEFELALFYHRKALFLKQKYLTREEHVDTSLTYHNIG